MITIVKGAMGGGDDSKKPIEETTQSGEGEQSSGGGGFLGGIGDKLNSAAGGGKESEKNEDYLYKGKQDPTLSHAFSISLTLFQSGVDMVQQYGFGGGDQSNESAMEQAKDEQISDFLRGQYKSKTGSDIPIQDKEH